MKSNRNKSKEIVIIGGGFAGINLAKNLLKKDDYNVTLVDRNNYNFFPPLIYQVATGFLEISSISYPFRKLFRYKKNISFRLGEFFRLDPASHTCYLDNGSIQYDYLVFAAGVETNYFGNENIRKNAIPMKTVNDTARMRNFLLQSLEEASRSHDAAEKRKLSTMVVAGGGPTGVEVADLFPSKFHVGGYLALIIWLFVHLTSLITVRNKFKTLTEWIIAYFTRDQALRMIVRPDNPVREKTILPEIENYKTKKVNI